MASTIIKIYGLSRGGVRQITTVNQIAITSPPNYGRVRLGGLSATGCLVVSSTVSAVRAKWIALLYQIHITHKWIISEIRGDYLSSPYFYPWRLWKNSKYNVNLPWKCAPPPPWPTCMLQASTSQFSCVIFALLLKTGHDNCPLTNAATPPSSGSPYSAPVSAFLRYAAPADL